MAGIHLDDDIGLGKPGLHVPFDQKNVGAADRIRRQHVVFGDLGMDHRRAGGHGRQRVQHERQLLPLDLDQPQRLLGDQLALGGNRHAHLVAGPGGVIAQHAAVVELAPHHVVITDGVHGVGPAGVGRLEPRHLRVLIGQDGLDPRQSRRLC